MQWYIRRLAGANILAYGATIMVNYLATSLPIWGVTTGELSDLYPNLFTPAWFTFSIWWVLYLFLLGFVLWQASDAWKAKPLGVTATVWPWFLVASWANIWWIFAWHYKAIELSVGIMLLLLGALIILVKKVKTGYKRWDMRNKIWTQTTFSLYLGRISVATIANVAALLVAWERSWRWLSDVTWTCIVLIVTLILSCAALIQYANIPYVLVVLWAYYGIVSKRIALDVPAQEPILRTIALASIIISFTAWLYRKKRINSRDLADTTSSL